MLSVMPGSTSASGFDEASHPRGQPDNPGKFRRKQAPKPPLAGRRSRRGAGRRVSHLGDKRSVPTLRQDKAPALEDVGLVQANVGVEKSMDLLRRARRVAGWLPWVRRDLDHAEDLLRMSRNCIGAHLVRTAERREHAGSAPTGDIARQVLQRDVTQAPSR